MTEAIGGLRRSARLFQAFRVEQTDPDHFYTLLAQDTVRQLASYAPLAGRTVVDVGGGAGYFAEAIRQEGAQYYMIEPDRRELVARGDVPADTIVGDGYWLPLCDSAADVCFSSNVLEHVPDPVGILDEMIRVTRPGGIVYVSFTNWYSPWGGHETSPWHYLGGEYAVRRYLKKDRETSQEQVPAQPVSPARRRDAATGSVQEGRRADRRAA